MEDTLRLLLQGEYLNTDEMAKILAKSKEEVEQSLKKLEEDKVLLGWRPVIHPSALSENQVRAVIEVKISPERDGGFDRLANRISRFETVESCYLMSGGYDLLVVIKGENLHQVATFVTQKLATIERVLSTATHFLLKPYKEQGFFLELDETKNDRLPVSP